MGSIILMMTSVVLLGLGYYVYSPFVEKWLGLDKNAIPPSEEMYDGDDYVPAKHWIILLGHHFSSIAGAAPIIGPVVACLIWGWVPALIWLVIGGVIFGGVHDLASLHLSLEFKGKSITSVTQNILGRSGRIMFSVFAFCALILIVAVFAAVAGKTLADTPEVVIPTFGLVVVALIVGFLMYKLKFSVSISSVIGIIFLGGLIWLGYRFPLELPFENSVKWWTGILLLYGLIASVTPVTVLLQPRDHLAAFVLFIGLGFGFLGIIISHPEIKAPAFVAFKDSGKGWLWPMLFVTIACGAISGFHSLVASGTTSKQLPAMRDARKVGYGAMILESALSVLAVICVTAGLYWKQVPSGEEGFVYQEVFSEGGWIKAFGRGYGTVTKSLFGGFGFLIGITMLKTFIMTTLDSATRITRYMVNELFGEAMGIKFLENKYTATLLVGVLSGALALGNWQAIWPVFGAANQLIASLVLLVVTVYLIKGRKPSLFTLIPGILIFITTFGAMFYNIKKFLGAENPSVVLIILSFVLIAVAFFMLVKAVLSIREALNQRVEQESRIRGSG